MRILVTGHRGQLGQALLARLENHQTTGLDLPDDDITSPEQVRAAFDAAAPELVIHAAALTNVDYCAEHPDEALRVNAGGTHNLALACLERDVPLLYISTNEVFDGQAATPYREYDPLKPVNPYGYSKFAGEEIIRQHLMRFYIVRTAWLYAASGTNFIHKIVAKARQGQQLRVVTDEVGSPTYANDLAEAAIKLAQTGRYGTYHLANAGACSRYEFAQEILRAAGLDEVVIEPITSDAFERASTPPAYSALHNTFAAQAGIHMRTWQAAATDFVQTHLSGGTSS